MAFELNKFDLTEDETTGSDPGKSELTVTQLNKVIKSLVCINKLKNIDVCGEMINIKDSNGHKFFTLKDAKNQISAIMYSNNVKKLTFPLKDGMQVIVRGSLDFYEPQGRVQLQCTEIIPKGDGADIAAFERVKQKLSMMGIFKAENKKKLPESPHKIGVITSRSGAAVKDVLSVIKRRFPSANVVISPTSVQGVYAEQDICNAIQRADNCSCDVLILTRGGGSKEDLKVFNSESVTMAVYNCKTPIISAVGHETDTPLCDYAADMRAPTPSAAAEIAVPQSKDLTKTLAIYERTLKSAMKVMLDAYDSCYEFQRRSLMSLSPSAVLDNNIRRLEEQHRRMLSLSPSGIIKEYEDELSQLDKDINTAVNSVADLRLHTLEKEYTRLCALDPLAVLKRGYAHVTDENGKTITAEKANVGDTVNIKTAGLEMTAKILTVNKNR